MTYTEELQLPVEVEFEYQPPERPPGDFGYLNITQVTILGVEVMLTESLALKIRERLYAEITEAKE